MSPRLWRARGSEVLPKYYRLEVLSRKVKRGSARLQGGGEIPRDGHPTRNDDLCGAITRRIISQLALVMQRSRRTSIPKTGLRPPR